MRGASQLCKYIFLWDRTYCLSKLKGTQDAHHKKLFLHSWDAPGMRMLCSQQNSFTLAELSKLKHDSEFPLD